MLQEKSSFRDPAGQVVWDNGIYKRLIFPPYYPEFRQLIDSGLYDELIESGLLIKHEGGFQNGHYIEIVPEQIPFISYPYEWCFSMLKEAALNTLEINRRAIAKGMMLKDASAYNMQYYNGNMTLIDTCSFVKYEPGMPWGAYRQFCQHFLYPLLLMAYYNPYANKFSQLHIDGIGAGYATNLLPFYCHFKPSLWAHVYAQRWNVTLKGQREIKMSEYALGALLNNLESTVKGIKYNNFLSDWLKYSDAGSYSCIGNISKPLIMNKLLSRPPACGASLCDMGSNIGTFSEMANSYGWKVLSIDSSHDCIEKQHNSSWLSLVLDLCNPSPSIGFANQERRSFLDRLHVDTILALALIHHICVGNNVPLARFAELLAGHCKRLIIEWVPLEDPKAQLLLGKKNIPPYSLDIFKEAFGRYFNMQGQYAIEDSKRIIFDMEAR